MTVISLWKPDETNVPITQAFARMASNKLKAKATGDEREVQVTKWATGFQAERALGMRHS